eukprot:15168704-Alexandrium_andersonii.AAC.1
MCPTCARHVPDSGSHEPTLGHIKAHFVQILHNCVAYASFLCSDAQSRPKQSKTCAIVHGWFKTQPNGPERTRNDHCAPKCARTHQTVLKHNRSDHCAPKWARTHQTVLKRNKTTDYATNALERAKLIQGASGHANSVDARASGCSSTAVCEEARRWQHCLGTHHHE